MAGMIFHVAVIYMVSSKLINAVLELTYMIKWNGRRRTRKFHQLCDRWSLSGQVQFRWCLTI